MVSQQHHRPGGAGLAGAHRGRRRPPCAARPGDGFDLATVMPLVRKEVRRFRPWRLERDDLVQAGVAGALEAWRRRDPDKAGSLPGYTSAWVRKELQQTVARGDFTVAVPPHVPPKAVALRRQLDHGLALRSAARQLHLTDDQTLSLDRLLESPDNASLDAIRATDLVENTVLDELDREAVRWAVASLTEPQRSVVILRFGFDGQDARSTREIGRLVGVSDFTVRAQLRQAAATLRARLAALADDR